MKLAIYFFKEQIEYIQYNDIQSDPEYVSMLSEQKF